MIKESDIKYTPWYMKIILWFVPTHMSVDIELPKAYYIFYKEYRGNIYVVGQSEVIYKGENNGA